MANLYDRLDECFPSADATFAILADDRIVTYGDIETRTARFANQLRALGVTPGDRVAVQAEKSIDMVMLYLAIVRAGAVFLPLNTAYTPAEIGYFLGDAEPRLFVCDSAKARSLCDVARAAGVARVETLDHDGRGTLSEFASAQSPQFATVARADDDLAAILYTSGTTGRSKGAMITHENLASNAFVLRDYWRFTQQDVLLHALPIFHTHGLFVATNTVLAAGASMLFLPRFDVDAVLAALPHATTMMGVPTFYIRLLDDPRFNRDTARHMRLFVSGSAPLSADVHRTFEGRAGHAILERYGMTETNMNTSNPYDGARRAGTVGIPLPGVSIRIIDADSGAPLPNGQVGVIEISGPNVFAGYWRQPEKTAEELRGGWFSSGDLGLIDEQGYVAIVGRAKDLIISGGYNIYPAEVETVLDEISGVRESAVIGVPHSELGEAVVAVIAIDPVVHLTEEMILNHIKNLLARYKQPRAIHFVEALPRNAMAKVQKAALRERYGAAETAREEKSRSAP